MEMTQFFAAGEFVDSDAPQVIAFAKDATQGASDADAAILRLYTAVRDGIIYDPYVSLSNPANYRASSVLAAGRGFCIGKSALLAASARAIGVPARVGYADVRNHLTSRRLYEVAKTDTLIWHSYTELYLDERWVKATPAFDSALCERAGSSRSISTAKPIRCFSRSTRPGGGTWNICATAARSPTYPTLRSRPIYRGLSGPDAQRRPRRRLPLGSRRRSVS